LAETKNELIPMSTNTLTFPELSREPRSAPRQRVHAYVAALCLAAGLAMTVQSATGAVKVTVQPPPSVQDIQAQQDSNLPFDAKRLGLMKPVSALFGKKVIDLKSKTVGQVKDFILDLSAGQVVAALVVSGGRAPITPVPARSFEAVRRDKAELNAAKKLFESAPRFPLASTDGHWDATILADSFLWFNQAAPAASASGYCSAVALIQQPVISSANEALGQVQDIAIDLPIGRGVYLVIEPTPGLDPLDNLYLVPLASVHLGSSGKTLILEASREHFLNGHHFPREFPSDMVFPEVATAVYQHYGLLRDATAKSAANPAVAPPAPDAAVAAAQSDSSIARDQGASDSADAAFDFTLPLQ